MRLESRPVVSLPLSFTRLAGRASEKTRVAASLRERERERDYVARFSVSSLFFEQGGCFLRSERDELNARVRLSINLLGGSLKERVAARKHLRDPELDANCRTRALRNRLR